jgi:hypothetical protein
VFILSRLKVYVIVFLATTTPMCYPKHVKWYLPWWVSFTHPHDKCVTIDVEEVCLAPHTVIGD